MGNIISSIEIRNFRSFINLKLENISSFTALTGLNNAGKSNVLRALNLFFNGEVEPGSPLNFTRDFNLHAQKKKQRKEISIAIEFTLPNSFKIRKEINQALGDPLIEEGPGVYKVHIEKLWRKSETSSAGILSKIAVNKQDYSSLHLNVEKFLSLFKYRYIPHGANPLDFLSADSVGFLLEVYRRLKPEHGEVENFLKLLDSSAEELWKEVSLQLSNALGTSLLIKGRIPNNLTELIRLLPIEYEIQSDKGFAIATSLQGAGIQLYVALHLLYLLDSLEPGRSFGWRQAFIWGIEEPENSLHKTLESELAAFFKNKASTNVRFQAIASTHSEIFASYSQSIIVLRLESTNNSTEVDIYNHSQIREGLQAMSSLGIGAYIEPILANPASHIILVEGKTDSLLIKRALQCIGLSEKYQVISPEDANLAQSGGEGVIKKLLNDLWNHLAFRPAEVYILLDWDTKLLNKIKEVVKSLKKQRGGGENIKLAKLDENCADGRISRDFKGIELFLSHDFYEKKLFEKIENISRTTDDKIVLIETSLYGKQTKPQIQKIYSNEQLDCSDIKPLICAIKKFLQNTG